MFGKLRVGGSHHNEFSVEKRRGYYLYKRGSTSVKLVSKKLELEVRPMAPVNLPDRVTDFFIVSYPKLHIAPGERIITFLKVPLEVGVFFQNELVDVFGYAKEEFVLYGYVDGGTVARRVGGEVVEEPIKWDGASMVIPLRIKNYTDEIFKASKLLLDSSYLDIYYDNKRVATEMVKLDLRKVVAPRVRYLNRSHFKDMTRVRARGQVLKKEETIEMGWGV
ncbi:DUF432 domain-containing protein [Candidatus Bathyarchaeota archaeon]|nr:DUF432 domain-containing protein [Candidatus Bathyarchaeota archaeon]